MKSPLFESFKKASEDVTGETFTSMSKEEMKRTLDSGKMVKLKDPWSVTKIGNRYEIYSGTEEMLSSKDFGIIYNWLNPELK